MIHVKRTKFVLMNKTYKAIFCRSRRALCHSFKVFWQKTHVRLSGNACKFLCLLSEIVWLSSNACKFLCLLSEFVWVQPDRCWESSMWINQKNQNGCPHEVFWTHYHLDSQQNVSQSGIDFFQPRPNGYSFRKKESFISDSLGLIVVIFATQALNCGFIACHRSVSQS